MHRILSLIGKLALAIGLLALVLWNGLVDQSFIKDDPVARFWLLAVTGALVLVDAIVSAIRTFRAKGRDERKEAIRKALLPVLRQIARTHQLDVTILGASTYTTGRKRLKRVDRYRMSELPQESKVTWISNKGVIGQAWKTSEIRHVDWLPIHKKWGKGQIKNEADWALVPDEDRFGFEMDEFNNIVDKYSEILAVPMLRAGSAKCVGVLAIDVPIRANAPTNVLQDDEIVEKAAEAAGVIQQRLNR